MSAWTDMEMLAALDLRDHEGKTGAEIARALGRSRSAVLGMLSRVDAETDRHDASAHLDGTMPRKWWRRGEPGAQREAVTAPATAQGSRSRRADA